MLPSVFSEETFKVLAIDPGSSNLGYSILEYNFENNTITVEKVETINVKTTDFKYKHLLDYHNERNVRMMMLKDVLEEIVVNTNPHAVIAESNYMGRFANGFAALVECVSMIRNVIYEYNPFLPLFMVDPTTVKINAGLKKVRGTTKEDVKVALVKGGKLNWNGFDPETLDEHSIDSLAIGLWYMENVL